MRLPPARVVENGRSQPISRAIRASRLGPVGWLRTRTSRASNRSDCPRSLHNLSNSEANKLAPVSVRIGNVSFQLETRNLEPATKPFGLHTRSALRLLVMPHGRVTFSATERSGRSVRCHRDTSLDSTVLCRNALSRALRLAMAAARQSCLACPIWTELMIRR